MQIGKVGKGAGVGADWDVVVVRRLAVVVVLTWVYIYSGHFTGPGPVVLVGQRSTEQELFRCIRNVLGRVPLGDIGVCVAASSVREDQVVNLHGGRPARGHIVRVEVALMANQLAHVHRLICREKCTLVKFRV